MTVVYRDEINYEETYSYVRKTVTVDVTDFIHGDRDEISRKVYTFGKRSVYSTCDALKSFESLQSHAGIGFPWPSYMGNIISAELDGEPILKSSYVYNNNLLPTAGERDMIQENYWPYTDIPLSFTYTIE